MSAAGEAPATQTATSRAMEREGPPRRSRPGGEPEAASRSFGGDVLSIPEATDIHLRARRHDHAILVLAERIDGIVTTQLFTNLAAAEMKVARTRERGLAASLTLVRLTPMPWAIPADYALVGGDAR